MAKGAVRMAPEDARHDHREGPGSSFNADIRCSENAFGTVQTKSVFRAASVSVEAALQDEMSLLMVLMVIAQCHGSIQNIARVQPPDLDSLLVHVCDSTCTAA